MRKLKIKKSQNRKTTNTLLTATSEFLSLSHIFIRLRIVSFFHSICNSLFIFISCPRIQSHLLHLANEKTKSTEQKKTQKNKKQKIKQNKTKLRKEVEEHINRTNKNPEKKSIPKIDSTNTELNTRGKKLGSLVAMGGRRWPEAHCWVRKHLYSIVYQNQNNLITNT